MHSERSFSPQDTRVSLPARETLTTLTRSFQEAWGRVWEAEERVMTGFSLFGGARSLYEARRYVDELVAILQNSLALARNERDADDIQTAIDQLHTDFVEAERAVRADAHVIEGWRMLDRLDRGLTRREHISALIPEPGEDLHADIVAIVDDVADMYRLDSPSRALLMRQARYELLHLPDSVHDFESVFSRLSTQLSSFAESLRQDTLLAKAQRPKWRVA